MKEFEITGNLKYLVQQIKEYIISLYKKDNKPDNWLLTKRPLYGNLYVSFKAYIGYLKYNSI